MSNTKSKISDNTVRHPHSSRHRQLSRRRNLNRLRSLNRQRRLSHLRRWRHLRTLYHNIGSWLPRYKNYTQKNGLFPVPFWVKPHHVPFRSEERPDHITLMKYIRAWRKYYDYLRNVKSASINTTRNYMSDIVTFHEYLSHKYRIHKESLEKLSNYKIWLSEKNTESDEDPLNIDLACAHLEWCNSIKYGKKSEINPSKWEIKPYEGWQEYEQLVQWLGQPNTYPPNISPSWEKEIRKAIRREETESQLQEKLSLINI